MSIQVIPEYAHQNGGPVLISIRIADENYPRAYSGSVPVPISDVPLLIRTLSALLPGPKAIGTPIPTDAEVAATVPAKPRDGFLRRLFS